MKSTKATHGQLRRDNRQLLLRAVHSGLASSRAELSQETGLAKPTVSDLISELINEGFLIEIGLGQSTDEGGKRPRLLQFVPDARHIIGVSLSAERALGEVAGADLGQQLAGPVVVEAGVLLAPAADDAVGRRDHDVVHDLVELDALGQRR